MTDDGAGEQWISIPRWRGFQHYDPNRRTPPWIKIYEALLHDPDWLRLTPGRRAMLVSLWLEYCASKSRVRADDTAMLSRRLAQRVTSADLEALNHAGWIDIVASKTLAEGYRHASPRAHAVEAEEEGQEKKEKEEERERKLNGPAPARGVLVLEPCNTCGTAPARYTHKLGLVCDACRELPKETVAH